MVSYSSSVTGARSGCDVLLRTLMSGANHASFFLLPPPLKSGGVKTSMSNTSSLFLSIIFS